MNAAQTVSKGFEGNAAALAPVSAGVVAAHQREESELQAMFAVAHNRGRSELDGYNRAMSSCERPAFADGTTYNFPRGGKAISGPSVKLARELARVWGRIAFDLRIVDVSDEQVHIRAVALDLVHVTRVAMEDKFSRKIQRRQRDGSTQWVEPDERDLRELINRRGAILVRNCLLQLLPPDLVEDAVAKASATLVSAASGDLQKNRSEVVKALLASFDKVGVKQVQIEEHIGSPIAKLTPTQCQKLRAIYQSLVDGHTEPLDHFEPIPGQQHSASALNEELGKRKAERETAARAAASKDTSKAAGERQGASQSEPQTTSDASDDEKSAENAARASEAQSGARTQSDESVASDSEDRASGDASDAPDDTDDVDEDVAVLLDVMRSHEKALKWEPRSDACRQARAQHLGVTQARKASLAKLGAYIAHLETLVDSAPGEDIEEPDF